MTQDGFRPTLSITLLVNCPYCKKEHDLVHTGYEDSTYRPVWDLLEVWLSHNTTRGVEPFTFICPRCEKEFHVTAESIIW